MKRIDKNDLARTGWCDGWGNVLAEVRARPFPPARCSGVKRRALFTSLRFNFGVVHRTPALLRHARYRVKAQGFGPFG
jgi:hypothetical protein